jgi:hypothetical protein
MNRDPVENAVTSFTRTFREPDETAPIEREEQPTWPQTLRQELVHEHRIARLEERVMILEQTLPATLAAIMAENQPVCTNLLSLGIPGYRILRPIPVTLRQDGSEFIATFFDANISTGGETQQEAVTNLQDLIADFYDELATMRQEELGPSLQRQKLILVEFVCRT